MNETIITEAARFSKNIVILIIIIIIILLLFSWISLLSDQSETFHFLSSKLSFKNFHYRLKYISKYHCLDKDRQYTVTVTNCKIRMIFLRYVYHYGHKSRVKFRVRIFFNITEWYCRMRVILHLRRNEKTTTNTTVQYIKKSRLT